ncbi:MAG TPA: alpha/beta fold hydrolase [Candidatus Andersenbacteria bacterium]|nr:alpha/beta fold hydrolase [Candidatus Andersenbacteria bacterium]
MKKRVFIVHGWGGNPNEHWLPWLKGELEQKGFEVHMPSMPNTDEPIITDWVGHLSKIVGELDSQTYFVGHSVGCQTIMRYLETQAGKKAGGCVLVAAWFILQGLENDEEERIAKPWMQNDVDYEKIRSVTSNISVLNSSNDDYGAVEVNKRLFKERLHADVKVLENRGHFTTGDGITQLPEALEAIEGFR